MRYLSCVLVLALGVPAYSCPPVALSCAVQPQVVQQSVVVPQVVQQVQAVQAQVAVQTVQVPVQVQAVALAAPVCVQSACQSNVFVQKVRAQRQRFRSRQVIRQSSGGVLGLGIF